MNVRRLARRAIGRIALALPATAGPESWRHVIGRARIFEARRLVRSARDAVAAMRAVDQLLDGPLAARAWSVVAEARRAEKDIDGALEAVRLATIVRQPEFEAVRLHHQLALAAGNNDEAQHALSRLAETKPRNPRQFDRALEAFIEHGADDGEARLEQYRTTLRRFDLERYDERLDEAISAVRMAAALPEPDRFEAELKRAVTQHSSPAQLVVKTLIRRRAWAPLAAYLEAAMQPYAGNAPADHERVAVRIARALAARKAPTKALAAGQIAAAVGLARLVLDVSPDDAKAQEVLQNGSDQLAVVARGWSPEPVADRGYDPRDTAVVSVLAQSLPLRSGGYATRSHGVLTGLSALGWDMSALTRLGFPYDKWGDAHTEAVPPLDVVDGIQYHRLLDDGVRDYPQYPLMEYIDRFAGRIADHAKRHRANLIHASSFHVNGLAGAAAARRLGIPFLYEMRGLEDLMKVSRDPSFAETERHEFLTMLESQSCLMADRVFVITDALKQEMVARGVPEDRMVVLPNGVDTAQFTPRGRNEQLERELGVQGKTVIGYAGGLVDYEGLDLLLEAAAALRERRSDFHVVIVGDGHYQGKIKRKSEQLQLGDVVTFTGRVPHDRVSGYLSIFDITPFPRLPLPVCELISPIKPFEAMAMSKAVVVSSVAALTEIVQDGQTGLVFEKGSAESLVATLERLIEDPLLCERLGSTAREWVVTERDWSAIVQIVDRTYRELI